MKAILVDDEPLSLMQLRTMLEREVGGVEVIGAYSDPFLAVESVERQRPDTVFLDIHMPGMNGLKLGERLQTIAPDAEIVFITGYNQYAVEAFELCALDYIMKPVLLERLKKTVQRLRQRMAAEKVGHDESGQPLICCFKHMMVQFDGTEPRVIKWRTSKAQELFAYLLHYREKWVSKDAIVEWLWPNYDVARATQHLYTTIYNIRQTLKKSGLETITIRNAEIEGGYILSVGDARIDTVEWVHGVKQLADPKPSNLNEYRSVLEKYAGDYLEDYDFLWAENERERLRNLWLRLAQKLSRYCMEHGREEEAVRVNRLIQQRDPFDEESYFNLMKLYDALNDREAVEEQYRLLLAVAEKELECPVNGDIKAWYDRWQSQRKW